MSPRTLWTGAAIAALVLAGGCKSADDETEPAVAPKTFAFEGKVDPLYVGHWKSADGTSNVDLNNDSSMKFETHSRSMSGNSVVNVSGQWAVSGKDLLLEYSGKTPPAIVLKYTATLSGKSLTLQQPGSRVKTVYTKK